MAIKGVMRDGSWIDDLGLVKNEFFDHFRTHFSHVSRSRFWCGLICLIGFLFFNLLVWKFLCRMMKSNRLCGIVEVIERRALMALVLLLLNLFGTFWKMILFVIWNILLSLCASLKGAILLFFILDPKNY